MPTSFTPAKTRAARTTPRRPHDWLGLWAVCLGLCATALAAFVHFLVDDALGAAMILLGVAAIIATVLRVCAEPARED